MRRRVPTVAEYMTPNPHWIGAHQALSEARSLMREHRIRHLPVLRQAKLVGVLSERDVSLVTSLRARGETLPVEDAMTPMPYAVAASAPLDEVARVMEERRYGSAVVMWEDDVIGVFTTTDALRALVDAVEAKGSFAHRSSKPERARGRRARTQQLAR